MHSKKFIASSIFLGLFLMFLPAIFADKEGQPTVDGWWCETRQGECWKTKTCSDQDGCHWRRRAWVTQVSSRKDLGYVSFETKSMCEDARKSGHGDGLEMESCRYLTVGQFEKQSAGK